MEHSRGGGGGGGGGSGGGSHNDASQTRRKKTHYHRHTAQQIQRLEGVFNECPHPDEKMRLQLSRELGLSPRQIKFWFQNRRTQLKAQHEKADNYMLRAENDKIRCENIAIREALKNVICTSCGGPDDSLLDEQKLRIENANLKEELERVSSIAAKFIGRPGLQLHQMQPHHLSSLDLFMSSFGNHEVAAGPSPDLVSGNSSTIQILPLKGPSSISDIDKSLMVDIARNAMDEMLRLLQSNLPFWMKSPADGREVLDFEVYQSIFSRATKNPNVRVESSKDSRVVVMNSMALVDMLMDANKWTEFFPTIVSRARTVDVISTGLIGSKNGSLQLMYEEIQLLSPLVPTRQFYFLRFCQQMEQSSWAIVDVSYNFPEKQHLNSQCRAHRLPSGCFIQDMLNGHSKITWIEHMEIEDIIPVHNLYKEDIYSGLAFGAERRLATLQRTCERFTCLMDSNTSSADLGGVIPSPQGKRSMLILSQRMVKHFCSSINPVDGKQWTLSGVNEFEVRATLHRCTDPGQTNGMVLSAATTIWLPFPPRKVFDFFRDERTRSQWDVLSDHNPVQEVARIACGSHPGNYISLLQAFNTSQNMLILQESCIDSSGALVVYCPVDLTAINIVMSGEDPSYIPLLPSGFAISPETIRQETPMAAGEISDGSLVTVVVQILVSNSTSGKISQESVNTVNNLVGNTIQQIKVALNCSIS